MERIFSRTASRTCSTLKWGIAASTRKTMAASTTLGR
jgi:hypothetical protein